MNAYTDRSLKNPVYQAYQILHVGFIAAPILAGLDKFFNVLAQWDVYVAPQVAAIIPAPVFMKIAGIIEIAAGVLVAFKPKLAAPVVGLWLTGIIVNLLLLGGHYDVALRDLGLALAAFALWRLATVIE